MTENEEESKPRLFGVRDLQGTQQIPRRRDYCRSIPGHLNTRRVSRFSIPDQGRRVSWSANPLYSPAARALAQSIVFFPCSGQAEPGRAGGG